MGEYRREGMTRRSNEGKCLPRGSLGAVPTFVVSNRMILVVLRKIREQLFDNNGCLLTVNFVIP
jgi:hypothetical protein